MEARPARGGACLRCTAPGSDWRNDISINMGAFVTERVPWSEAMTRSPGDAGANHRRIEMMVALLLPMSTGALRLLSPDPQAKPSLDYNYLADPFDRQRLRAGVRLALALAEHDGLKELIGPLLEPATADLTSDAALDA